MFDMFHHAYATVKTVINLVNINQSKVLTGHVFFLFSVKLRVMLYSFYLHSRIGQHISKVYHKTSKHTS